MESTSSKESEQKSKENEEVSNTFHQIAEIRLQPDLASVTQEYFRCATSHWPEINLERQYDRSDAKENIFISDETNDFEVTGSSTRLEDNLFELPPASIFFGSQDHLLGTPSYLEARSNECDVSYRMDSPDINSIYKRDNNAHQIEEGTSAEFSQQQDSSSLTREHFPCGTSSYLPETTFKRQQERNGAEENIFPSDETNDFEVTGGSAKSKENVFKIPPSSVFLGPQQHPLTSYSDPETRSFEYEVSEEMFNLLDSLDAYVSPSLMGPCEQKMTVELQPSPSPQDENRSYHTEYKPYECGTCKKRFPWRSFLKKHERIHTGDKPYECRICKKKFCENYALKRHERIHTGEKPYECKICNKKLRYSRDLKVHEQDHTGNKSNECMICKKEFKHSYSLKIHQRVHTGERPYECEVCKKKFSDRSNLRKHLLRHTREKQ